MKPIITVLFVLVCLGLAACVPVGGATDVATDVAQSVTPTAPSTPTPCPFVRNPGPPPPEVVQRAREALTGMSAEAIYGEVNVQANGEYYCDQYLIQDLTFEYTLVVQDLTDQAAIEQAVEKVKKSAQESAQDWDVGVVRIRFMSGQDCWWDDQQNACAPIRPLTSP